MTLTLRPIRPADESFLYRVYASTRTDELAQLIDWDDAQKEAFLRMQFTAQHTFYQQQFADAAFDIILLNKKPIGRLYLDRRADEIRIIDIALLPTYRNRGIGSQFLKRIMAEATDANVAVRIHVEQMNPALRLYERLGFQHIDENGVYYLMEWRPAALSTPDQEAQHDAG